MKRLFISAAAALLWITATPGAAHADDNIKSVQQSLRDQGFYYGSIDGAPGDETTQAIRRYQIRNGLQVNGQLNDETRTSILRNAGTTRTVAPPPNKATVSIAPDATPRPRSTPTAVSTPRPAPVVPRADGEDGGGFRRDGGVVNPPAYRAAPAPNRAGPGTDDDEDGGAPRPSARPNLRVPEASSDARPMPQNGIAPSPNLTALFEGTPYELAPPPVQADTLRRAQNKLLRQGFYDREPDGRPNPVLAEALVNFQGFNRLRRTGRLDTATLSMMHLLPGERQHGGLGESGPRRGPGEVYEGRVVQ